MKDKLISGAGIAVLLWCLVAWSTHVIVCLLNGEWGYMLSGALVWPIGIGHGTGWLFGWW